MKWILHVDVEPIGQFIGEPAVQRPGDPRLERGHERAVPGEPDRLVGPQAVFVEAGDLAERIVAPAMGVAGQIVERLEFAEDGEIGMRAERLFERRQVGDLVTQKVGAQGLRVEGRWAHNVRVPTPEPLLSEL